MSLALQQIARELVDLEHRKGATLKAPSAKSLELINTVQALMMEQPQIDIRVEHMLHAGMYLRTVMVPADVVVSGALMNVGTALIVSGDATITTGDDAMRVTGYNVLAGMIGRKQIIRAHSDTCLTMAFPTKATTIGEAEREFTDEYELLQTYRSTL